MQGLAAPISLKSRSRSQATIFLSCLIMLTRPHLINAYMRYRTAIIWCSTILELPFALGSIVAVQDLSNCGRITYSNMASPQSTRSKDGYISIPSLVSLKVCPDLNTQAHNSVQDLLLKSDQDIEKATPPPPAKAYGTISIHDESKMDIQPAQAPRSPLGYILISLVYSLLVVGAFTMGAFVVVSVFL
jgi:hypothetical protein